MEISICGRTEEGNRSDLNTTVISLISESGTKIVDDQLNEEPKTGTKRKQAEEEDDTNKKAREEENEKDDTVVQSTEEPDNESFVKDYIDKGKGIESNVTFDDSLESLSKLAHSTAIGDEISLELTDNPDERLRKKYNN